MAWAAALAAALFAALFLHWLRYGEAAFLAVAEPYTLYMRIVVPLIRPDPAMRGIARVKQVAVVVLKGVLLAPLCQFLWFLDDVLYPAHRAVPLHEPVFILAPPRTGSTSLHRALVSDEERFFAPLVLELFFPFITIAKALHYLHDRPRLRAPVEAAMRRFVAAVGIRPGEVAQRHPMGLFREDEDDIALTLHHQTSEICWCAVSHVESFLWGAHMHRLPPRTQRRSALFLTRVYQKIAYMRGRGRTLCTKSHLCAISRDFGRIDSSGPEYRAMRLAFLRELHGEVRLQFGAGVDVARRVLTFENFVADAAAEVAALYDGWGVAYDMAALRARVSRYLAAEEHAHSFGNATWAEMGIKREELAQLVQCPMLTYGRLNKRRGAGGGADLDAAAAALASAPASPRAAVRRSPRPRAAAPASAGEDA